MTSSKDQKIIDDLKRANDDLKRNNEVLRQRIALQDVQIADLRRALERRDIWAEVGLASQGKVDQQIEKLQKQRDQYRGEAQRLNQENQILKRLLEGLKDIEKKQLEVIDPRSASDTSPVKQLRSNGRWQRSLVGITLIARDDDGEAYEVFHVNGLYNGEREVAILELGAQLWQMLLLLPELSELPKIPNIFDSVPNALEKMISALLSLYLLQEGEDPKEVRLRAFNEFWQQIDTVEFEHTRPTAMDRFYGWLDRAITSHEEKRRLRRYLGAKTFGAHLIEGDMSSDEV